MRAIPRVASASSVTSTTCAPSGVKGASQACRSSQVSLAPSSSLSTVRGSSPYLPPIGRGERAYTHRVGQSAKGRRHICRPRGAGSNR
eukprot:1181822-Prorocentrum_minimum.AAC.4